MRLSSLPFTLETALQTVRSIEDGYNGRDPGALLPLYTIDCQWRVRAEFIWGRDQIQNYLARKWRRDLEYRAASELWAFGDDRIALRFIYEYHNDSGSWFRAYGNESLLFSSNGLISRRISSINEHPIEPFERKLVWPLGRRPDEHLGPVDLDFGA